MANNKHELGITVKKSDDMAEWYSQLILKSKLADYGPVKGTMVIRPYGFKIWENIKKYFNRRLRKNNVDNAYFPVFIPESFFYKEAEHAEGFKPEVAWIEKKEDDAERFALRPTSETVMYDSYAKWIRSWRDLPLKINQWCNIVRWEVKDVKIFLRSREFLWQEGHCVYSTEEECDKETMNFLNEYKILAENMLAIPVITGKKTQKEKFAGAKYTTTIEGLMPDGKALQMGTSHNLGQGFAKAFDIRFVGKDEQEHLPWQSSWGFSTRLLGSIILMHGDDKGLIMPPKIAPNKVVIVPILFEKTKEQVLAKCNEIKKSIEEHFSKLGNDVEFDINPILDDREEYKPGFKFNEWELKGIPLRIEIGPRDLENNSVVIARRDNGEKITVNFDEINDKIKELLQTVHNSMFEKANNFLKQHILEVKTFDELNQKAKQGNMVIACHCGEKVCEEMIKFETAGITTRAIIDEDISDEKCVKCGKPAKYKVYFARNY